MHIICMSMSTIYVFMLTRVYVTEQGPLQPTNDARVCFTRLRTENSTKSTSTRIPIPILVRFTRLRTANSTKPTTRTPFPHTCALPGPAAARCRPAPAIEHRRRERPQARCRRVACLGQMLRRAWGSAVSPTRAEVRVGQHGCKNKREKQYCAPQHNSVYLTSSPLSAAHLFHGTTF